MASLGTLTLDLVARVGGFIDGLNEAQRATMKVDEATKKSAASIDKYVRNLQIQAQTARMSTREAELFRLTLRGASKDQLDAANSVLKANEAYEKGVKIGETIKTTLLAVGAAAVAAGAATFAALGKGIEEAAKFQDLAEMTGGSAEGFASLAVAAATAGVDMNSVAAASIKLTKNLTGLDDESKAAGAALTALGIPIKDFQKLSPEDQIDRLTQAFGSFADGTGKTAIALDLWGKSGAEQLKLMKALYEQGGRTNILTADQIKLADDYADRQAKLRAEMGLYAAAITTLAIPSLNAMGKAATDLIQQLVGTNNAQNDLARNLAILDWAEKGTLAIATLGETAVGVAKTLRAIGGSFESVYADSKLLTALTPTGAIKAALSGDSVSSLLAERNAKAKEANDRYADLWNYDGAKATTAIKKAFADQRAIIKNSADPEIQRLMARSRAAQALPVLDYQGKAAKTPKGAADDPTKKLLENELAAIKAQGEAAKELLADRNKVLDLYNSQGLLSVKDYYTQLQGNLDEATAVQAKSYDDQIAALKKFQAAASKQTDVADAQGKVNKLEEDKAKLYRQSGTAALESSIKQVQAQKAVKDAFDEVNAKVLEFQGNLRAAGEIRFDAANEKLITQAKAEQNEQVVKQIELLKQYTLAQADINKLQSQFSLAQGDLQIAEERITIARERGTMGEIESLKASGQARREAVALMQEQLEKFQAIDAAARTPEQTQAIERLKLQLEGLKATIDPLADKINTMFSDAAGSALGDFITGTKTAQEAFKDFSKTVINEIARMAAKDLAKSIFGGSSGSSSVGGFFSSLFGGSSGSASSQGASGAGLFASLFSMFGFASGGFTGVGAANDPAGIVHKGEYVLTAEQTKRIGVANLDRGNFGGSNIFNINVPETVNRNTGTQIAAQAQRKMMQGARNT